MAIRIIQWLAWRFLVVWSVHCFAICPSLRINYICGCPLTGLLLADDCHEFLFFQMARIIRPAPQIGRIFQSLFRPDCSNGQLLIAKFVYAFICCNVGKLGILIFSRDFNAKQTSSPFLTDLFFYALVAKRRELHWQSVFDNIPSDKGMVGISTGSGIGCVPALTVWRFRIELSEPMLFPGLVIDDLARTPSSESKKPFNQSMSTSKLFYK